MALSVDNVLHEAQAIQPLLQKYQSEMSAGGFGPERTMAFQNSVEDALTKDTAQRSAQAIMLQRTQEQNAAAHRSAVLITMIQNAAKSAFYNDKVRLKEFRVGMPRIRGAKDLLTVMEYFTAIAKKYEADLLANGIRKEDLDSAADSYTTLATADGLQENAKKLRNAATLARNAAVKKLREEVFRIRKFALARFALDPVRLEEFKSVTVYKRKSNAETPASAAPDQALVGAASTK